MKKWEERKKEKREAGTRKNGEPVNCKRTVGKIEASASVDSISKKRRSISLRKYRARKQKIVRAPKTAMRRFYYANI